MKNKLSRTNMILMVVLLLLFALAQLSFPAYFLPSKNISRVRAAEDEVFWVTLQIPSPSAKALPSRTPVIVNLNKIADMLPTSVDPFGYKTPTDVSDDVKWEAIHVFYNGAPIPFQVDDIDDQVGFSGADELVFQLPEDIPSGTIAIFSIYLGTNANNLPIHYFPDVCTVYEYPKIAEVTENFGADMLKEAYYIENSKIQACALVDAAWSSGGLYELSVLDEYGNSQWDAIKQRFDSTWESWKWARFATVEQFIELNEKAGTNNFFLPDPERSIIQGPVRARIRMQSIPPYGDASSIWGTKPGVFGVVTYDLYANLPYLDYTLDITGPNAANYPTLMIELQNREKNPGISYSPYKSIYVPGTGWRPRNPDDLDDHAILGSEFSEYWYVEKLAPGETMFPEEPDADKLGFGMIFADAGFTNITYKKGSEELKMIYDSSEFPLHGRYFPFDATITNDAISYMENSYQDWLSRDLDFAVGISTISISELPPKIFGEEVGIMEITADVDPLVADKPVIIQASEFSSFPLDPATIVIKDGDIELPTQADDLDGDGVVDEIVFQLPHTIAAKDSKVFSLYAKNERLDNGQSTMISVAQAKYHESFKNWLPSTVYSKYINTTGHIAPAVATVGDVVWIDTDRATMCVYLSAGWRQSSFKHVYVKDDNWDLVKANWDPWTDWRYNWTRTIYDADYGWHDSNEYGNTSDTIELLKVGPVRCVLQTLSGIGYKGALGIHDNLRALRTFTFYNGFSGIHQNLRLTGGDEIAASIGMTALYGGPLQFATKYLDFSIDTSTIPWTTFPDGNGFDMVYGPGTPNKGGNSNRYQAVDSDRAFDLSLMTATYFGMYSSGSKNGYMSNFALGAEASTFITDHLTDLIWSDGEIQVFQEFEEFSLEGINRVLVPFSGSDVVGADLETHIDTLNNHWAAEYTIDIIRITTATSEPTVPTTETSEPTKPSTTTESEETDTSSKTTTVPSVTSASSFLFVFVSIATISYLTKKRK
ncbi:MAG: DUF4861 family protein [Candidatus Heimdallarchaeota archaeon]|nr:MAG: DUF4861 family protein [Candidatus Heimdallarchaeota archaeon]